MCDWCNYWGCLLLMRAGGKGYAKGPGDVQGACFCRRARARARACACACAILLMSAATHPTQLNTEYVACLAKNCGDPSTIFPAAWGTDPANKQKELAWAKANANVTRFNNCSCTVCRNYDALRMSYLYPEACTQAGVTVDDKGLCAGSRLVRQQMSCVCGCV